MTPKKGTKIKYRDSYGELITGIFDHIEDGDMVYAYWGGKDHLTWAHIHKVFDWGRTKSGLSAFLEKTSSQNRKSTL